MKADCWRCHYELVRLGNCLGVNDWAMPPDAKLEWLRARHVEHAA